MTTTETVSASDPSLVVLVGDGCVPQPLVAWTITTHRPSWLARVLALAVECTPRSVAPVAVTGETGAVFDRRTGSVYCPTTPGRTFRSVEEYQRARKAGAR